MLCTRCARRATSLVGGLNAVTGSLGSCQNSLRLRGDSGSPQHSSWVCSARPEAMRGPILFSTPMLKGRDERTLPAMSRPRLYSSPERKERIRASKQAWVARNADKVREQHARERTAPDYREKRRRWYLNAKQAKLDAGFRPKPRGRPRVHATEEERLAAKRHKHRESMRRWRA